MDFQKSSLGIFLHELLRSIVHVGVFKKCTVTCVMTGKMDFLVLKKLEFLAGQTDLFFLMFLLSLYVMDVTVRLMCCISSACLP